MAEDDLLNFNYPMQPRTQIQEENRIKQELGRLALSACMPKEVERYSDRYASAVSREDIQKTINMEIMSPELQRSCGSCPGVDASVVLDDMDEEGCNNSIDGSSEHGSLEGGDDYEQNYYEEDEMAGENNQNEEVF